MYISLLCSACIHMYTVGLDWNNNFLTTINIPAVNHNVFNMFKKWQHEISSSLQTVTEESVASALLEEQEKTM